MPGVLDGCGDLVDCHLFHDEQLLLSRSVRRYSVGLASLRLATQTSTVLIDPKLVWEAVQAQDKDVVVYDVEGADYRAGHVPGAFSWPSSQVRTRFNELLVFAEP